MCGICGIWHYRTKEPIKRKLLRHMTDSMTHRGPDDSGFYFDDAAGLGLGFRRLAIIDLSPAGAQPMANEDETVWLIFNGEIYNFSSLRPKLEAKGHVFRSRTDSEVIIHQYEEHGAKFVSDLNGMFSFAIWDERNQRMVLARDRVGKKPLYYYDDGQHLIFASELKALLTNRAVPRELDYCALGKYLAMGYIPSPYTILRGIKKLPPGHMMIFEQGQNKLARYWDWLPAFRPDYHRSEDEWSEDLRALLKMVVRDRLVSDVPLGAFLSGGVDSSAVVAMMAELSDQPIKTFSIGFKEEAYNELNYARLVAERFSTDHHEYIVEPEALHDILPRLVRQFDEPFADSSAVPTYYVSKMAREQVTVVLSGDGGDETLAGYRRYAYMMSEAWMDRIPSTVRRGVGRPFAALIPKGKKGHGFAHRMTLDPIQRYLYMMRWVSEWEMATLLTPEAAERIGKKTPIPFDGLLEQVDGMDYLSLMQYIDGLTYLPEDILVKVDRTSMLNSLETRCPLLDYQFMETVARIPAELRLHKGQSKYLLKRALRGILPDEILNRTKMGFGVPLQTWFRDELSGYIAEVLLDRKTLQRGLWQPQAIQALLTRHRSGLNNAETPLWVLLVLELWWRVYLDD